MNTSVIILTANRRALLEVCLASLRAQVVAPTEVVVVENGSSDGTAEFLAAWRGQFPLRVFAWDGRGSFAEARNAGLAAATGDAIAFLDDDCEADPRWLGRLGARLASWQAVGGAVLPANPVDAPEGYSPQHAWAAGLSAPGFFTDEGGVHVLPQTANLAFRRELIAGHPFQEIGGGLGRGAGNYAFGREDAEWWRRLRRSGVPCGVEPRAIVWHHIPASRHELAEVEERAIRDGAAFWRRERPHHALRGAAADVVAVPRRLVQRAVQPLPSLGQAVEEGGIWAARQQALLSAAVDDHEAPLAPLERAGLYAREVAAQAGGLAKELARGAATVAYHSVRRSPPIPRNPRRIAVIIHPFLGDSVLALPMLHQLGERFPDARRTLLTSANLLPLMESQLPDWTVVAIPPSASGRSPRAGVRLRRLVERIAPEVLVVAYAHRLAPWGVFGLPGTHLVGWEHDNGTQNLLWGQLFDTAVEKRWDQHESVALMNLAAPLGVAGRLERPRVVPTKHAVERVRELLGRIGCEEGGYVVLHAERPSDPKYWPTGHWAELVRRVVEACPHPVLLEGSRGGRVVAEAVGDHGGRVRAMHGVLGTDELAALLAGARAFVGADSGPQHLAAAVGCPSLVLFGPTDERRWGPAGEDDPRIVIRKVPFGGTLEECDILGRDAAMRMIAPGAVAEALFCLLGVTRAGDT